MCYVNRDVEQAETWLRSPASTYSQKRNNSSTCSMKAPRSHGFSLYRDVWRGKSNRNCLSDYSGRETSFAAARWTSLATTTEYSMI